MTDLQPEPEWRNVTELPEYEFCEEIGLRHKETREISEIRVHRGVMRYCHIDKTLDNGETIAQLIQVDWID